RMIVTRLFSNVRTLQVALRCNYGATSVLNQAVDPIQQLFVDKIRAYDVKAKEQGTGLVDATPEVEKRLEQELGKVAKAYGGGDGIDMTAFPTFEFTDPVVDPLA
ncbi:unnamed protein product, partial [Meganyctiphanes norvegica]